jgi:hypothetical protein
MGGVMQKEVLLDTALSTDAVMRSEADCSRLQTVVPFGQVCVNLKKLYPVVKTQLDCVQAHPALD